MIQLLGVILPAALSSAFVSLLFVWRYRKAKKADKAIIEAKDAQIVNLHVAFYDAVNTIKQDQSGMAMALAEVNKIVEGYSWVTEGRGPYAFDDERYKSEMLNMLTNVETAATNGLRESGIRANKYMEELYNKTGHFQVYLRGGILKNPQQSEFDFFETLTLKKDKQVK